MIPAKMKQIAAFYLKAIRRDTAVRRKKYKQLRKLRQWRDSILPYAVEYLSENTRITLMISLLKNHPNVYDATIHATHPNWDRIKPYTFFIEPASNPSLVFFESDSLPVVAIVKTLYKFYFYEAIRILNK